MSSIGGTSFFKMDGKVAELARTLEDISHPSVDGHSYSQRGQKSAIVRLQTTSFLADESALGTLEAFVASTPGSLVTIVDSTSFSLGNVMVLSAQVVQRKRLGTNTEGAEWMAIIIWEVQATE